MTLEKFVEMLQMCLHNIHLIIFLKMGGGSSCRNLNLGFATKARACKGAVQEGSPRITSHAPNNVGECEGMNPHIPK
jgi:hypothetical protein